VIKAQQTVKAKGHTVVTDPAVAATYTKTGKTEGSHCSVCGTVIKAQTVVPKLVKEGLVTESGNTFYYKNGKKQTGWQQINKKWYFFNSSGVMQTGWMKQGGKWYYLGTDGAMVTGWKQISKKWYYFKSSGEMAANEWCKGYWLNKDGTWTFKTKAAWKKDSVGWWFGYSGWYAKSQWQKIDDKWYYFDAKGHIVTGTRTIGGKTYRFNASGVCLNP
jgi:glucan-binding YG repeat protein